jgi:hypothetical protein
MIKKLLKLCRRITCKHEFKDLNDEIEIGMTVSWGLNPTKEFQSTYECVKCGKQKIRKYIYFGGIKD